MTVFTEPFTGSLALTWTNIRGSLTIAGGGVTGTLSGAGSDSHVRADHDTGSTDMYSQVVLTAQTGAVRECGVVTRFRDSGDTQGYALVVAYAEQTWGFSRQDNGSWSGWLSGPTSHTFSLPTTVRLESEGGNHRCYINGSLVATVSDSAIATGSRGGIATYNAASQLEVDNFETGSLAAGPTLLLPIRIRQTP
jgi:hypothetical protein